MKLPHPWHHVFFMERITVIDDYGRVTIKKWRCTKCCKEWVKQYKHPKWTTEILS